MFLTNFVKTCAEVNDMGSNWSVGFTEWFIWVYNNARGCNSSKSQESPNHVKSPVHFCTRMSHVMSIVYLSHDYCLPLQVVSPATASGSSEGHLCCGRFPGHLPTWGSFFSLCQYAMFKPRWQLLMNSFAIDGLFISCHISLDMSPRVLFISANIIMYLGSLTRLQIQTD